MRFVIGDFIKVQPHIENSFFFQRLVNVTYFSLRLNSFLYLIVGKLIPQHNVLLQFNVNEAVSGLIGNYQIEFY